MQSSPKVAECLQNLNLTSVTDMVKQREAGLFLSPKNNNKKVPLVVFGKYSGLMWGFSLHDDEENSGSTRGGLKGTKKVKSSKLT